MQLEKFKINPEGLPTENSYLRFWIPYPEGREEGVQRQDEFWGARRQEFYVIYENITSCNYRKQELKNPGKPEGWDSM